MYISSHLTISNLLIIVWISFSWRIENEHFANFESYAIFMYVWYNAMFYEFNWISTLQLPAIPVVVLVLNFNSAYVR